jgi:glycosyltransferase involved in cell wall biosynthesis
LKILVLTFYYRPDLCAGSFRSSAVVEQLRLMAPPDTQIDVITTQPNRYQSYTAEAAGVECHERHEVFRVPLPRHRSGMLDQSRAFASYARGALEHVRDKRYDVVFATSSRLMTLVLATRVAKRTGARLYLDIRDIFVQNVNEVLPRQVRWLTRRLFSSLEKYVVRHADKVNLVSPGFAEYFHRRYPGRQFGFITNGIDDEFLDEPIDLRARSNGGPVTVVYAGNVGDGQGLHAIIPGLAKALADRVQFRIIGDGARKPALRRALDASGLRNVVMLEPMNRAQLIKEYRGADVLFMHLNDYEAFKHVLPSKVFEYAAMGKPLWAGVAGFAAEFVTTEVPNSAVFEPCDVAGGLRAFECLTLRSEPRAAFVAKYARARLARELADEILTLAGNDIAVAT